MCKCTPEIRTPFCGKPGCEMPKQKNYLLVYMPRDWPEGEKAHDMIEEFETAEGAFLKSIEIERIYRVKPEIYKRITLKVF